MDKPRFHCQMCSKHFQSFWSDHDAMKERANNGLLNIQCGLVCDDCYRQTLYGKADHHHSIPLPDKKYHCPHCGKDVGYLETEKL